MTHLLKQKRKHMKSVTIFTVFQIESLSKAFSRSQNILKRETSVDSNLLFNDSTN